MNTTSPEVNVAYNESSFRVLKGLEPVRERPGMYTRTESPTHIIQEVIDNAVDEALGGFAKKIHVTLHNDNSISVKDDGRGIPVGMHAEEGVPVVTLAFTRLHAGGKFDKKAGGAYAFSGGLHGVGVAVTTALSTRVRVQVNRDMGAYEIEFTDGGRNIGDVVRTGDCGPRNTGTEVRAWPDPKYFDSPTVNSADLERLLRSKAVLLPGVKVSMTSHDGDKVETKAWEYPGGLSSYLQDLAADAEPVCPIYTAEKFVPAAAAEAESDAAYAEGEGASFAFAWFPEGGPASESYVNLIPTPSGGTHETGLKAGVYEAVKSFIEHHGLLPRGVKIQQDDVVGRMSFIVSAKVLDPQFQGQTKERLNSRQAHRLLIISVRDPLEAWLNGHVEYAKAIAEVAIKCAMQRQKSAVKIDKRRSSGVVLLPGKLTDCEATEGNEIFLVEGDSAGGSAKMARDRYNQAVLPLRGKVLNTWEVEQGRLFANQEIHDISVALGVDPHTRAEAVAGTVNLDALRYTKVVIMTDADVDGSHIQTLLLTHFFKHLPALILGGHIHIAMSPLYKIDVAGTGKKPPRRNYALDEAERISILDKLKREGVADSKITIGRFKGLGEMNAEQLKETSMDPATRRVIPVKYSQDLACEADAMFNLLMSETQSAGRRDWMALKGASVDADI